MSPAAPDSPSVSAGPRPLQLVDGNVQSSTLPSCPSPTTSGLSTPPPSARKFHPRRQSSITYYPSDHTPSWDLRSPTTPSGSFLKRSSSFNQGSSDKLALKRNRRSLPASDVLAGAQAERPLTLTEKHADLLQFIAQKESKCLELRSQLAVHEAELAQLKRKWERIVSRGMDRAYSQPSQSGSASSSLLSGAMKEGVQGVGRLLASGLSEPAPKAESSNPVPAPRPPTLALRTSRIQGHVNTQSISSVATSATSLTSSSVRLSQSSASSLAFDEDEEPDALVNLKRTSISVDGGTGIESPVEISPSSAIKAAKLHRRKSREAPPPPPYTSAALSPQEDYKKTIKRSSLHISSTSGVPPAASIPGLGPLASPRASAWMGSVGTSVGKKWEELQKGETFSKGQKRASLLISDVSSSIFAALASPSATSTSHPVPSSFSITSNPFAATLSPLSTSPQPSSPSAPSLLDDDDAGDGLGSVLVPDTKGPVRTPAGAPAPVPAPAPKQNRSLLDDDDEWNW
ncbi:uncharacterized protein TRAVEDRAFT_171116 [Trametes versicolor FP-101664 SS1]|uniref:uncharacterized protein n=1 Tax=Trametes versicolor (strain FP-101664) TaxID=717944 RepID=UPI00046239A3|nr:uncharacterized protein TRAVEDRAFT_171116 [Trametes versicolor FP-101664 SS1]EIW55451.1 hypothetical protein TRAVEDRAFT_171116 [Trametes versicolor FP-101664 SS1]